MSFWKIALLLIATEWLLLFLYLKFGKTTDKEGHCKECGKELTDVEKEFYICYCERCEAKNPEKMKDC